MIGAYLIKINAEGEQMVLENHKRVGKKLIPPLIQYSNMEGISWQEKILPEIIWIGLLIEKLGLSQTAEICTIIAEVTHAHYKKNIPIVAFASSYSGISKKFKDKLLKKLKEKKMLSVLSDALSSFIKLYPKCPLKFLVTSKSKGKVKASVKYETLQYFKDCLRKYDTRRDKPAMLMQGTAFFMVCLSGKLKFFSHIQIPDPNDLLDYPMTEESRKTASSIRCQVTSMCGINTDRESSADIWCRYFWEISFKLDKCEFTEEPKANEK